MWRNAMRIGFDTPAAMMSMGVRRAATGGRPAQTEETEPLAPAEAKVTAHPPAKRVLSSRANPVKKAAASKPVKKAAAKRKSAARAAPAKAAQSRRNRAMRTKKRTGRRS